MERSTLKRALMQFPAWLIEKFKSFRWKNWILYCILLFFVGTVINHATQYRFPHFVTHQLLLIAATTLLVCAMKMFFLDIDKLNHRGPESLLKQTASNSKNIFSSGRLPCNYSFFLYMHRQTGVYRIGQHRGLCDLYCWQQCADWGLRIHAVSVLFMVCLSGRKT